MSNFDCHVKEDLNEEDAKERERKRERWRKACGGPPEYVHNQNRYCVLHYPGEDKEAAFKKKRDSKLAQQDYDFRGAVFPISASSFEKRPFDADVKFAGATFHGEADFRKATFRREADFSEANFAGEARFRAATFKGKGDFAKANFEKEAGFRNVTFEKEASFAKTVFKEEAKFRRTIFQGFVEFTAPSKKDPCETHTFNKRANFSAAKFEERAIFLGQCTFDTHQQEATFRNALIEKPENFSFDRVRLRPSWFIDTNVQQLRFTYVQWRGLPGGPPGSIEEEIKAVKN